MTKMLLVDAAVLRGLLAKAGDVKIANQAGYAFYGHPPRWHKVTTEKPAPKGAPVAAHPEAAGSHGPLKHFTDAQWAQLKLPDDNVNAPSFNAALEKLKGWSDAGNVTAIVGSGYGTNTYGKKLATIANQLLSMHSSPHQVAAGQKAGTHAGVQAAPDGGSGLVPNMPVGQVDGPLKGTHLGGKLESYPDDKLKDIAENHSYPKIKGHAQAVLDAKGKAAAPAAGPLQMPDFAEGKTTKGVKAYYEKVAQKVIDHGHAGNHAVLADMPDESMNSWKGKTPNSKKLLALHAEALAHAKGGASAAPAPVAEDPATGWKAAIVAGKPPTKEQAEHMAALETSDPDAYMSAFMEAVNDSIPADQHTDEAFDDALDVAHSKAFKLQEQALGNDHGAGWDKASDGSNVYANHPKEDDGPKEGDTKIGANGGTLVLKDGHWVKEGDDAPAEVKPEYSTFDVGDVFKLDSQFEKMNAGQWKIYNISADGTLVHLHKVGVQMPNQTNMVTVPAFVFSAAIEKGTAKKQSAARLAGKPAYDHIAHAKTATTGKPAGEAFPYVKGEAQDWLSSNPGAWDELNDALKDHGYGGYLDNFGPNSPGAVTEPKNEFVAPVPGGASGVSAAQLGKLQSIPWFKLKLPDSNSNAASVNKKLAALQEAAFSGDVAAIEAMKFGSNTYGKKLALAAQTAVAALKEGAPDAPAAPADDKVSELSPAQIAGLKGWLAAGQPTSKHPDSWSNLWKKLSPGMKKAVKEEAAAPVEPPPVTASTPLTAAQQDAIDKLSPSDLAAIVNTTSMPLNVQAAIKAKLSANAAAPAAPAEPRIKKVSAAKFTNTTAGHNKFWAVSIAPDGLSVMTTYGKIGGAAQKTVKQFGTFDASKAFVATIVKQKLANGYQVSDAIDHFYEVAPKPGAAADAGPKDGDTKQGADGMLVFKNGRWHKVDDLPKQAKALTAEQIKALGPKPSNEHTMAAISAAKSGDVAALQAAYYGASDDYPKSKLFIEKLATQMGASLAPPGSAAAVASPVGGVDVHTTPIPSMDDWEQIGGQGGSNPGGKFRDPATGTEYYCKFPADEDMARSEVLAAKLYGLAGLSAQQAMLVRHKGKLGIASKWVDVKKAASPATLAATKEAQAGFAVDAWLANWDVVGLGYDNLQVGPDGKAVRVDAGGSLEYRAQGALKPFGPKVGEIDTLRDSKMNPQAAAVFGKMTDADMTASAAKVIAIDDAAIRAMVFDHGPGDEAKRKQLADMLIARKADLLARFPKAGKPAKKKLDPSALPIAASAVPKTHDFVNWNGPGKGLSSSAHVNKSNQEIEQQMRALALAGNMTALKDFHYDEISKDTGHPTGKKIPVAKHPSKHVQQYQQDLLQVLDEIANPPEPLKVFSDTDVSSLAALSAAFPPKPFGTTVSKVASNEKLGFWVALGSVGGVEKFRPKSVSHYSSLAIAAAFEKFKNASKLAKKFISGVQASGSYNDLFRDGKTHDNQGNDLKEVAQAALAHATEMPEGTTIYRWQKMSPQMIAHIMSAKDGTVFQATGPMCTSYSPTATAGFGTHRVVIRYAKGAKGVESFGSGGFSSEKEVTTLPNNRFVILSKKMVPDVEHGASGSQRLELEILMLPPDLGIK